MEEEYPYSIEGQLRSYRPPQSAFNDKTVRDNLHFVLFNDSSSAIFLAMMCDLILILKSVLEKI